MGQGTLTIYSASAGSGKTYELTAIYLTNLFRSRYNYRKILAVTFTNKATAEMKSRILDHLHKLAVDEDSDYLEGLIEATSKTEAWIRQEAKEILNSILHDFSRFSVSTIDSFFQKVLRAFSREIGLHSGFSIELDHSTILSTAVDEMIASAADNTQLRDWLISYAKSNIEEEKSWNLKASIISLGEELFKERFKILSFEERSKLEDKKFLLEYIKKIRSKSFSFENKMADFGKRSSEIFSDFGLTDDLFYRKGLGIPGFIKSLVSGNVKGPNSWVREIENDPPRWSTGSIAPNLEAAIGTGLDKIMREAIHYHDDNIIFYRSAECVLSYINALGILSDVLHNIHLITTSENSFLLSDAGELLSLITSEDQSSFIYEKVGNRYENFMIDEFQDTSKIQWNNFKPLIDNSMSEGFDNLVVGDVKQSIYRWRNSDWTILGKDLISLVDNKRVFSKPLTTNWRSRSNIISFNNALFTVIPDQIDKILEGESVPVSFKKLYSEAVQQDQEIKDGGYVRLEFVTNEKEQNWKDIVLERLPQIVESVQDKGYNASDIGIIVRDGKEGARVIKTLIDHKNKYTAEKKISYNLNAVSNDSLLLSNSPVINFIIGAISVVNNPENQISRAIMLRFFLMATGDEEADKVSLQIDKLTELSRNCFPEGYEFFLDTLREIPLFEATESIINFFRLGDYSWNVPFLNTFQDYVLFTGSKNADIQSFIDWWDETGKNKSVVLPANQDAIRILTIHKSKGLEFKVVILPFLSWNLDHIASKQPVLWVKPDAPPFNELGIIPVKYSKELTNTIFSGYYKEEKYSVYLDNLNLLYVALTRAKDVIYAFSVDNPRLENTISGLLKNAMIVFNDPLRRQEFEIGSHYNIESRVFEYGEVPVNRKIKSDKLNMVSEKYIVSRKMDSLRLKLHGENYFSSEARAVRQKINYGKLMHEVFEGINTPADISGAVRKLVLEGKVTDEESADIEKKVNEIICLPQVAEWFLSENEVLKEAGILLPAGITRRPDRVIFKDGKTKIIDFKFGEERLHYAGQVRQYRDLLADMGYNNLEAFIWYVDKNKIVSV